MNNLVLTNASPKAKPDELLERDGLGEVDVGAAVEVGLGAVRGPHGVRCARAACYPYQQGQVTACNKRKHLLRRWKVDAARPLAKNPKMTN